MCHKTPVGFFSIATGFLFKAANKVLMQYFDLGVSECHSIVACWELLEYYIFKFCA